MAVQISWVRSKSKADQETFRPYLIGRQSQINGWTTRPENTVIVNRLVDLIATKPTLMLGLSAQDANIQAIFAAAQARMEWPWPGERPSYVFSEDEIGIDQRSLLHNVYRSAFTPDTRQKIQSSALIRAYAKPLLVALVLDVLSLKLRKLIELAPGTLSVEARQRLQGGVIAIRNKIADHVQSNHLAFIKALIAQSNRSIRLFRDGRTHGSSRAYNPITAVPLQQIAGDQGIPASGFLEAAIAIGILGVGVAEGFWSLSVVDASNPKAGIIRISSAANSAKVYLIANNEVAIRLQHYGHLGESDDAILIHSSSIAPRAQRSPRNAPGRTGHVGFREVSIEQLLNSTSNEGELIKRFREEVAL